MQDQKVVMLISTGFGVKDVKYTENSQGMKALF